MYIQLNSQVIYYEHMGSGDKTLLLWYVPFSISMERTWESSETLKRPVFGTKHWVLCSRILL